MEGQNKQSWNACFSCKGKVNGLQRPKMTNVLANISCWPHYSSHDFMLCNNEINMCETRKGSIIYAKAYCWLSNDFVCFWLTGTSPFFLSKCSHHWRHHVTWISPSETHYWWRGVYVSHLLNVAGRADNVWHNQHLPFFLANKTWGVRKHTLLAKNREALLLKFWPVQADFFFFHVMVDIKIL